MKHPATPTGTAMSSTPRRIAIAAIVIVVLLLAWLAAGPWLAMHGIRRALAERDAAALERHVDFPSLRVNLKAHLEDAIARRAGDDGDAGGLLGAFGRQLAGTMGGMAVDAMVTPLGIGALLQGEGMWKRATGDTVDGDTYGEPRPMDPLRDAETCYESTSRFTASTRGADGSRVVAVFERQGLRWRLVDIRHEATGDPLVR